MSGSYSLTVRSQPEWKPRVKHLTEPPGCRLNIFLICFLLKMSVNSIFCKDILQDFLPYWTQLCQILINLSPNLSRQKVRIFYLHWFLTPHSFFSFSEVNFVLGHYFCSEVISVPTYLSHYFAVSCKRHYGPFMNISQTYNLHIEISSAAERGTNIKLSL